MSQVADFSAARFTPAQLRAFGYGGGIRYAHAGRPDVNISKAEADMFKAAAFPVAIVCEGEADFIITDDPKTTTEGALAVTRGAGLADGELYYAGDFDLTNGGYTYPGSIGDTNVRKAAHFLEGAAAIIGESNTGFYGGYFACHALAVLLPWLSFWQTEAWSDGMHYGPALLYQHAASPHPGLDVDEVLHASWGQRYGGIPPLKLSSLVLALVPQPPLQYAHENNPTNVKVLQDGMNFGSGAGLAVDGIYGEATLKAVKQTQLFWHLTIDGIAGPNTDKAVAHELQLKGL